MLQADCPLAKGFAALAFERAVEGALPLFGVAMAGRLLSTDYAA
jgi:hypothetical protein